MVRWAGLLEKHLSATVHRFDYGSRFGGALLKTHREQLQKLISTIPSDAKIILAGKSMGSRISCMLSAELDAPTLQRIAAIVCLGFPLKDMKGQSRAEVLESIPESLPTVLVQGTKDNLCPLADLKKIKWKGTKHRIIEIAGGDHSLALTKTQLKNEAKDQNAVDEATCEKITRTLDELST
jgi:predicted alpha/beta-hydrolase family hydrolase